MFNLIVLEGRLINDVERFVIPNFNGEECEGFKFTLVQDYCKDKVLFFKCVFFGKSKFLEQILKKGSSVIVQGKMEYSIYEKDGTKKKNYFIKAESVNFSMSNCGNKREAPSPSSNLPNIN